MKKLPIFLLLLVCSTHSFGQSAARENERRSRTFIKHLLKRQNAHTNAAAKTTATKQRLIARSMYGGSPSTILDSISIKYSGGRGSKFDLEYMEYAQSTGPGYPAFADVLFGYFGNGQRSNKNMGPDLLGDTFKMYSLIPIPPYGYGHIANQYHVYDGSNNMLDENWVGTPSVGESAFRHVLRYNSLSNIIRASYLIGMAGVYDTMETRFFIYNSANQLILDSVCEYDAGSMTYVPNRKYDFSYDAAGNMILGRSWGWSGSAWLPDRSYNMTYYPTNKLKTCEVDTLFSGGLPETSDSFGYTASLSYSTYSKHTEYGGVTPAVTVSTRHINAAGLADTVYTRDYGMGSSKKTVYTYNSYNNPETQYIYDSNSVMPTFLYSTTHYYYELYEATAVGNTATQLRGISVFPNPANNTLHLSAAWLAAGTMVQINISDVSGRSVLNETRQWQQSTEELSIAELLPGSYMVTVTDGKAMHYTQQIIKL